jgi:adenosine deaminase
MVNIKILICVILGMTVVVSPVSADDNLNKTAAYFESIKDNPPYLRKFLQVMPKGADIHTHLAGAIYAETYIRWAAEDSLCVDMNPATKGPRIVIKPVKGTCAENNFDTATQIQNNQKKYNALVDSLSMRNFIPTSAWSGHDQFFDTFFKFPPEEPHLGEALAEVTSRAGEQNIQYLELMITLSLGETIGSSVGTPWTNDIPKMYEDLMAGPFGKQLPTLVEDVRAKLKAAELKRMNILDCDASVTDSGCGVQINMLHQVIRTLPPQSVFASIILGWELIKQDSQIVGLNLVAPEDDLIALKHYNDQMKMIDYLYKNEGPRNVTLHAGELALGLVDPKELGWHIFQAIHIGHAKRIGHGMDIMHEKDMPSLLKWMADNDIAIEVNLTSNDGILGIQGDEHPFHLYKDSGVALTLNTDDEGVSRIDLTHEYVRAVLEHNLTYNDLKEISFNGIKYSFLSDRDKKKHLNKLEQAFKYFEDNY